MCWRLVAFLVLTRCSEHSGWMFRMLIFKLKNDAIRRMNSLIWAGQCRLSCLNKSTLCRNCEHNSLVSERKAAKITQSTPWKRSERQSKESCRSLTLTIDIKGAVSAPACLAMPANRMVSGASTKLPMTTPPSSHAFEFGGQASHVCVDESA